MDGRISDRVCMHGKNRLYNDGDNKVSYQKVDRMAVSESVLDRFGAIDIAVKMLGEPQPGFWLFTSEGPNLTIDVAFNRKRIEYTTDPSAFLWRKRNSYFDHVSLILTCNEDFTIKYPVVQLTVSDDEKSVLTNELNTEQELVNVLDGILHNL